MAEIIKSKTLNTILRLKYDSLANWKAAAEYQPMKGEVCIVAVPAATGQVASEPAILFKVGDGSGVVFKKEGSSKTELPWASGLAADVHAWAKAPEKPSYAATDISYGDTTVAANIADIWAELESLTGKESGSGNSISDMIATGIKNLGSVSATPGKYITGVSVNADGKLAITEEALPDYSNTYAAKTLENTVSTLSESFNTHVSAVSGYDARITAAQAKAEEGVANAATAQAKADAAAATAQSGVNNAATAQARADAAYTLAEGKATLEDVADIGYALASDVEEDLKNKVDVKEGYSLVADTEIARLATVENYNDTKVRELINGNTTAIENVKTIAEAAATKKALEDEIARAKIAEEANATNIELAKTDIKTLVGDDINKSIRKIANEELASQLIVDGALESLDTLQEIAAWIQSHPGDAAAMNAAIEALEAKITLGTYTDGEEEKEYTTVKAYVEAAIAAIKIGDYALASDLTALAGRVTANETAITNITKADGLIATAKAEAISTAVGEATSKANKAFEDAKAYTDAEIDKVEIEVNKKANDADLAVIAKTGNVNDLVQTKDEVLILFGGNAAGWTE